MKTTGRVNGIISNIVIVKADGPVGQNEICHVYCGDTKMMAEVIKVVGDNAYVQVFDSTRGLKIGEKVEFEGHMLEATLALAQLRRSAERPGEDGRSVHRTRFDHRPYRLREEVGVQAAGQARRQGFGRIVAGPGQGGVGRAQDHGTLHDGGNLYGQERRARRRVQGYGHDRRHHRCRRSGSRYYDGSAVAREAGRALLPGEATPLARHGDGRAGHRHFQPAGRGRYGLHPRTFRCG